ncbi:hypothetical protein GOBAR_DD16202 [Gossypium barbadense]|nr:hypothetical protein GOBAR_DD16202 [Gossypium barbadense]
MSARFVDVAENRDLLPCQQSALMLPRLARASPDIALMWTRFAGKWSIPFSSIPIYLFDSHLIATPLPLYSVPFHSSNLPAQALVNCNWTVFISKPFPPKFLILVPVKMEALGGNCAFWGWKLPEIRNTKRPFPSKSKSSDSSAESTGSRGYRFPLKQAVTASSLALTGDTIAQLSSHWRKRKDSISGSSDTSKGFGLWVDQIVESGSIYLYPHTTGNIFLEPWTVSSCNTLQSHFLFLREEGHWVLKGYDHECHCGQRWKGVQDIMPSVISDHDWLRALRMTSYGFLLYGPGSYAWYKYLDHCLPHQTPQNIMLKVLLNQIVLGPCVIGVVFAWNNLWLGKLSELPDKYQKDALPTLFYGFRFWIPGGPSSSPCSFHVRRIHFLELLLVVNYEPVDSTAPHD